MFHCLLSTTRCWLPFGIDMYVCSEVTKEYCPAVLGAVLFLGHISGVLSLQAGCIFLVGSNSDCPSLLSSSGFSWHTENVH